MASGIDTAIVKAAAEAPSASTAFADKPSSPRAPPKTSSGAGPGIGLSPRTGARRWPISPLTRRILAVNVLALALLGGGFLYLGKYQASLIGQQIESLKTQGEVFAAALGEGAVLD